MTKIKKSNKAKLLIVKVGSDERPAGPEDIEDMQAKLIEFQKKPNSSLKGYDIIVTHHAAEFDFLNIP